ncbi:hypothetical protein VNI00_013837 [Paramarasmius palmivorus]|uniref:Uncharacterized protein n=1 Tax=Paramarasmius palmivorus TaxID=297713 RepID=A0AAW0BY08_9AGAR
MSLSGTGWLELENSGIEGSQASHLYGQVVDVGTLWQVLFPGIWISKHDNFLTTPVPFILQRIQKEASTNIHYLTPLLRDICMGSHPEVEVAMATAPSLLNHAPPAKMEGFKAFGSWKDLIDSFPSYSFETHAHALAHSSPTSHAALDNFLRADYRQVNYPYKSVGHFFIIFGLASVTSVFDELQQEAQTDLLQKIGTFAYQHSLPLPSEIQHPIPRHVSESNRQYHSTKSLTSPSTQSASLSLAPSLLSLSPSPFYQPLLLGGDFCDQSKFVSEQALFDDGTIVHDSEVALSHYLGVDLSAQKIGWGSWLIRTEGTVCDALSVIGGGYDKVEQAKYGNMDEVQRYDSALDILLKAGAELEQDGLPSTQKGLIIGVNYHSYSSILENDLQWPTDKWLAINRLHVWAQGLTESYSWMIDEGFKPIHHLPTDIQETLSLIRYDHLRTIKDFKLFDPYLIPHKPPTNLNP